MAVSAFAAQKESDGAKQAPRPAKVTFVNASARADVVNAAMARRAAMPQPAERWVGTRAIIFDQATKTLRKPTSAETAGIVASLHQLAYAPKLTGTPVAAGGRSGAIEGGFAQIVIARATVDGSMETLCVQTIDEAAAFLGLERAEAVKE